MYTKEVVSLWFTFSDRLFFLLFLFCYSSGLEWLWCSSSSSLRKQKLKVQLFRYTLPFHSLSLCSWQLSGVWKNYMCCALLCFFCFIVLFFGRKCFPFTLAPDKLHILKEKAR